MDLEKKGAVRPWASKGAVALLAVLSVSGALSACGGGGFYLGVSIGGDDDSSTPPSVSVVASPSSVRPGDTVRLVAAAADADGIEQVVFYQLESGVPVLLGSDTASPFEWQLSAPTDGRSSVSFFARATDGRGERADSSTVTVSVRP